MAKSKTSFFCSDCGHETSGWLGRCPGCGAWNTLVEEKRPVQSGSGAQRGPWVTSGAAAVPVRLAEVPPDSGGRQSSGLRELDRVLGGGFVRADRW
jgi:DNA repair protein RadA/Sms